MPQQKADFRKFPIEQIPILQSISKENIEKIEKSFVRLSFMKGQEIVSRSQEATEVFIMLSGVARVIVFSAGGKAVGFRRINAGDLFGEFSAIDGQKRSATVEAVRPCTVLSLSSAVFWELLHTDKAFMRAVMQHLVGMLRSMTSRVVEFSTLAVKNRIQSEILRMATNSPKEKGLYQISPPPTHSELAARISTHREAVSRELSRLRQMGIIERRGRVLVVKDIQRLERMVHEASGE